MKRKITLILIVLMAVGLLTPVLAGDRSVIKIGHDAVIEVDMRVDDVVAVGGDVKVYGTVHGDAVAVGGDIYPVNKVVLLAPWIGLGAAIAVAVIFIRRRVFH